MRIPWVRRRHITATRAAITSTAVTTWATYPVTWGTAGLVERANPNAEFMGHFAAGQSAAVDGYPLAESPHKPGTPEHRAWAYGWTHGAEWQPEKRAELDASEARTIQGRGELDDIHPLWHGRWGEYRAVHVEDDDR